jgi:hypothetical protein
MRNFLAGEFMLLNSLGRVGAGEMHASAMEAVS